MMIVCDSIVHLCAGNTLEIAVQKSVVGNNKKIRPMRFRRCQTALVRLVQNTVARLPRSSSSAAEIGDRLTINQDAQHTTLLVVIVIIIIDRVQISEKSGSWHKFEVTVKSEPGRSRSRGA